MLMKWHKRTIETICVGTFLFGAQAVKNCIGIESIETWIIVVGFISLLGALFGLTVAFIASLVSPLYQRLKR